MFTIQDLDDACEIVYRAIPPTPQYAWPILAEETGAEIWVKHENHTPIGAFKVRGGLVYVDGLRRRNPDAAGIVSATRGNHGQSLAFAARQAGIACVIVVPHGNSVEKNAAMRAFGAELVEHGSDFDESIPRAREIAEEKGYDFVPSFHEDLVRGVATYAHEFLTEIDGLKTVYVPIGLGSGICGMITVRNLLGLDTEIVGVVSENAAAYALSFERGTVVETNSAHTFADGMAVRCPSQDALSIIKNGAARIVRVSDDEIAKAVRSYYRATHNLTEGAGAAGLAALMKERDTLEGQRVGTALTGHNIDRNWLQTILSGGVPEV